jgi:16S rRNA (cytosine967-C5)-methyltransferase
LRGFVKLCTLTSFADHAFLDNGQRTTDNGQRTVVYKPKPKPKPVSPARVEALKILLRVERDGSYSTALLAADRMQALSPEDRRLAHELVLGVLRWRGELDYLINRTAERPAEKLDLPVRIALWIGLYQIRHLARVPEHAAVNESVALVKDSKYWRAAPLVNAALRTALRDRPDAPDERVRDPLNRIAIGLSHPRWLVARWVDRFGEDETRALAGTNNEHPPVAFRINALRAPSVARTLEELASAGVEVRESALAPGAYVVTSGTLSPELRPVSRGWIYLQDEASQLVARIVGAKSGERILDVGAAPGGKSTQMASAMGNAGTVVAVDLHPARLATLAATCSRLATRIVHPVAADASVPLPFSEGARFDRVLLDAPCSGTGTLRRNPEIRWRLAAEDLPRFADLQRALLERAAERVSPGGRLVYATCSLEPEENEAVVEAFLGDNSAFRLDETAVPADVRSPSGYLRTFPHRHGSDGFFAAVLARE